MIRCRESVRGSMQTILTPVQTLCQSKYPPAKPGALIVSRSKRLNGVALRSLASPKGDQNYIRFS